MQTDYSSTQVRRPVLCTLLPLFSERSVHRRCLISFSTGQREVHLLIFHAYVRRCLGVHFSLHGVENRGPSDIFTFSLIIFTTTLAAEFLSPHNDHCPRQISVKDAVPLFHTSTLAPLLETSASMVDAHAASTGLSIVGFYQVRSGIVYIRSVFAQSSCFVCHCWGIGLHPTPVVYMSVYFEVCCFTPTERSMILKDV